MRRELFKASISVLTGRLSGLVTNFLFVAILARNLSVDNLGYYFLIANLVMFISIFARFGMEKAVLKFYSDAFNSNISTQVLSKAISTIIIVSCLITVFIFLLIKGIVFSDFFKAENIVYLYPYILLWFVFFATQLVIAEVLRAGKHFFKASLMKGTLSNALNLLVALFLIWFGGVSDLETILLVIVTNLFITTLVGFYWLRVTVKQNARAQPDDRRWQEQTKDILALSIPLLLNQVVLFVTSQSDIWIVTAFYGVEATAVYGACVKIAYLTGLALAIANGVLPPYISKYRVKGDIKGLEQLVKSVATIASVPAVAFIALLIIFPGWSLSIVYGESFSDSGLILQILLFGQLINILVGSCGFVLVMFGHSKQLMTYSILGGLLAIGLSLICVYLKLSIAFVALSYSIGIAFQQLSMLYLCKKLTNISTSVNLMKTIRYVKEF